MKEGASAAVVDQEDASAQNGKQGDSSAPKRTKDASAIKTSRDESAKEFDRVSSLFANRESQKRKTSPPPLIVNNELLDLIEGDLVQD